MNIKEANEALTAYSKETGRPKFADVYAYCCFLDYLDEYRVTAQEDYIVRDGVTIETVWSKYLEADSPLFTLAYGLEQLDEDTRTWFIKSFCTEIGEDNE